MENKHSFIKSNTVVDSKKITEFLSQLDGYIVNRKELMDNAHNVLNTEAYRHHRVIFDTIKYFRDNFVETVCS